MISPLFKKWQEPPYSSSRVNNNIFNLEIKVKSTQRKEIRSKGKKNLPLGADSFPKGKGTVPTIKKVFRHIKSVFRYIEETFGATLNVFGCLLLNR